MVSHLLFMNPLSSHLITVPQTSNSTFLCSIHHSAFQLSRVLCKFVSSVLFSSFILFTLSNISNFYPPSSACLFSFSILRGVPSSSILFRHPTCFWAISFFLHPLLNHLPSLNLFTVFHSTPSSFHSIILSAQISSAEDSRNKFKLHRSHTSHLWTDVYGTMKLSSSTYNFVEVSGHNLESSQTWGFCMDFLNHRQGGTVFNKVFLLSP